MHTPNWIRLAGQSISSNSPAILSGIAVAGVVTTVVLAVKATPEAKRALDERVEDEWSKAAYEADEALDMRNREVISLGAVQVIETTWRFYIPAGVAGIATIACIIGANHIGSRRNAALIGAYSLVDTALRDYKDEVFKQLGANKARVVDDAVAVTSMERNPVKDAQVIITGGGDQMCYDTLTGRYFRSDVETIRRAENEVNRRVLSDMYASHNEFYDLLGLAPTTIGDELGWNIDNLIELIFTAQLTPDAVPCLAIGYVRLPKHGYGKF